METLIVLAVLFLAFSNGANDNFKGVATLFGSRTATYRKALAWATVTTFAGSLLALLLARGLVDAFKGKGLIPDAVTAQPAFLVSVALGAALTVSLATLAGLPISTTHSLIGALVGAGLMAAAGELKFAALITSFLTPLLFSPLISMAMTLVIYPAFRRGRRALNITSQSCLCVGATYEPVLIQPDGALALARTGVTIQTGQMGDCVERYQGKMLGLDAARVLDLLHYFSGGAVGFARGLNDAPKIVALLLAAGALSPNVGLGLVAVVMAVGGLLNSRRVAETMSRKIAGMNAGQGFTANLVTSLLVIAASRFGLPVSTTHVSVGSLFGIGLINGTAKRNMILTILLAWVTTLPMAALLGALTYQMVR
jgi:PiT family inorganic phosphate transporter